MTAASIPITISPGLSNQSYEYIPKRGFFENQIAAS